MTQNYKKKSENVCQIKKRLYLCIRFSKQSISNALKRRTTKAGPFVYRLGRKIFILERGVRFPYGLQVKLKNI